MKIIMPEFVVPLLEERTCALVQSRELLGACDIVLIEDLVRDPGGVAGAVAGAEVVMVPWMIAPELLRQVLGVSTLRWVHTMTAGVEYVVRALSERALRERAPLSGETIVITNAAGIFDVPIAEMVLSWILAIAKRLPDFIAQQRAHQWHLLRLREASDLTVGIVGLGSIGAEIARRCHAVGMRVLATRRHIDRGAPFVDQLLTPEDLSELLAASDVVVVAVPLTPETRGLIDAGALRQMRRDAWLINIARGAIVDQAALVDALAQGWIGGAALDVFEEEPLPATSPLWDLPNVLITPHNSWSTPHFRRREAELFLDNLERFLRGEALRNVVDLSRGYWLVGIGDL